MDVSPLVRRKAEQLGRPGTLWLAELPALVAELCRRWSLTVLRPLPGGSASCVLLVRTADGGDAVLKLPLPDGDNQIGTIAAARGRGYVEPLALDTDRHAMLLEPLGPSLADLGWPAERAIEVLCATLREAWLVPRSAVVPTDEDKATRLGRFVTELAARLAGRFPERVVPRALRYAARRAAAFDPDRCVVVHGDPHPGNALRVAAPRPGAESGFVFVDPEGFLAEPEYDCGVVLRDWSVPLLAGDTVALARRYCRLLAERTALDEDAIWEWGFLERVATGLYLLDLGADALGTDYLTVADRLV